MKKFEEEFPSLKGKEGSAKKGEIMGEDKLLEDFIFFDSRDIQKHCLDKQKVKEQIHGSILSMGKYREGEIKEALDEFIDLLYKNLGL